MSKKKTKNKGGRPTKYNADFARQAELLISEGGFSITKLCKLFKIKSRQTLYDWMRDHKEFLDAIESGRDLWTNAKVKASLAKRAIGFRFTETTMEQQTDKETGETKMVPVRKVRKYVPPDVSAIKHWQTNRDPEKWRDKKDVDLNQKGPFSINWIMDDGEKK